MKSKIHITYDENSRLFVLTKPFVTPELTLPIGMKSDGFSSPWFTRWYVSRVDTGWAAAWVHDHCYQNAIKTKAWADLLFYKNLRRCKVKKLKARHMYLGVKYFGKGKY
ncbi:DUF1353 domain-containing protein [Pseudoalteromonas denitrificans]|jgi:hypothetical protein|uniref:DUF1353 domain-containing protein n=1 Tax=Pseudoalteromonas denitrificans DSM 6059 TaxID=1123010 RepID=A0A1I1QCE9_9GAMM|nr:DUF1353 domain-containing protein [Pseudoalteromonas denitrificans]SFD16903.1 Protein of unknown function [Pseudoalteromonas denitrificans DSM 6059]